MFQDSRTIYKSRNASTIQERNVCNVSQRFHCLSGFRSDREQTIILKMRIPPNQKSLNVTDHSPHAF